MPISARFPPFADLREAVGANFSSRSTRWCAAYPPLQGIFAVSAPEYFLAAAPEAYASLYNKSLFEYL